MALDDLTTPEENKDKRRSLAISLLIHILLLLAALLPLLSYTDPPPGQEGILVNLGLPDQGQGFDNAGPTAPTAAEPQEEPAETPEEVEVAEEEAAPPVEEQEVEPLVETAPQEVIQAEDPEQIALRKQQEEAERQRRQEELRKQREAEEARRRAEAEAQRKAEEEARKQAEAEALKNEIGGLFGEGGGKGKTGTQGNQGDPEGDPDASRLEGINTGAGQVGGGLSNRGVVEAPRPQDSSQNTGTVVVEVCVDANGTVLSANFTQRGSTTANAELVEIARKNARQWRFSKGEIDRQCGTITYNFRVR